MSVRAFISKQTVRERLRVGPLGDYIDLYATQLLQRGYTRESGRRRLKIASGLSHWLKRKRLAVSDIDESLIDRYYRCRKRCQYCDRHDHSALRRLLAWLRDIDVCAPRVPSVPDAREQVADDFRQYLIERIGLTPASFVRRLPTVRRFMQELFCDSAPNWVQLSARDVVAFVERHAHDHSPSAAQSMCLALRSFLRYLRYRRLIRMDLASALPPMRQWKLSALPRFLPPQQVQKVIDCCSRQEATGKRDYAVLLLLARLGLRSKEIAQLTLDDIDWHFGHITLRNTKTEKLTSLPLPSDVGAALVDYLQHGRPRSVSRRVFLRQPAPHIGFSDSAGIYWIVKKALTRAGVDAPHKGPHLFRHSLATRLLGDGASLTEIGQLLRHRNPDTTRIYAKVDMRALQTLALPWPGGVS